jgi:cell division protein FtsW
MFIGRIALKAHRLAFRNEHHHQVLFSSLLLFLLPDTMLKGRTLTWKHRIENFIHPNENIDEDYQVQQAKIAIAKGGFVKLNPGGSEQRNFLPHSYSDFIYAIIIEEYGLLGGAFIMLLYLLFLVQMYPYHH